MFFHDQPFIYFLKCGGLMDLWQQDRLVYTRLSARRQDSPMTIIVTAIGTPEPGFKLPQLQSELSKVVLVRMPGHLGFMLTPSYLNRILASGYIKIVQSKSQPKQALNRKNAAPASSPAPLLPRCAILRIANIRMTCQTPLAARMRTRALGEYIGQVQLG